MILNFSSDFCKIKTTKSEIENEDGSITKNLVVQISGLSVNRLFEVLNKSKFENSEEAEQFGLHIESANGSDTHPTLPRPPGRSPEPAKPAKPPIDEDEWSVLTALGKQSLKIYNEKIQDYTFEVVCMNKLHEHGLVDIFTGTSYIFYSITPKGKETLNAFH